MIGMWKLCKIGLAVMSILMLLLSCSPGKAQEKTDDAGEVKKAVLHYLSEVKQIDTSRMEVALSDLDVRDTGATCTAAFSLKEDPSFPPMVFQYALEHREGAWTVISSSANAGASPHGGPHGEASTHDLMQDHESSEGLPEGHPPVSDTEPGDEPAQETDPPKG